MSKNKLSFSQIYSKFGVFIILIVTIIIASFLNSNFLSSRNIINILRQNTVITLIAFGAQIVLICGDVDLSPGSVAAFSGCIAASVMLNTNSLILSVLTGVGVGCIVGAANGIVITKAAIPSFIMTLATQQAIRAITFISTQATPISGLDKKFSLLGQGHIGFIPIAVIILLVVFAVMWVLMNRTAAGRHFYAVGGNSVAAKSSGINVDRVRIKAFVIQGFLAGLGGVVLMSRLKSGQPSSAENYEFDAITAAIIGGTSMSGGIGNVYGTIAGAMFVGVLINIMTLTNVSAYFQQLARGVIIALAVIIDVQVRRRQKTA